MTETNTVSPPTMLLSPYSETEKADQHRINATINSEDWNLLRSVCPLHGAVNSIVGTFLKKVCDELRRNNIRTYNPDGLIRIVHECTSGGASGHTSPSHDERPTEDVPSKGPGYEEQPTDTRRPTPKRGRRN